ncbi:MAG: succinic semialdehyde dehydrogenase, partial [Kineosporiaceae bacterium]
ARAVQPDWAARAPRDRAAVLLRLHDLVLSRQEEGLDLLQLEAGKSRGHAFEELAAVAIPARWYARRGPALLADTHHAGLIPLLSQVREVHHPHGVVGVIAPWNYPLMLSIGDALPALLAGNAVVIKPDEKTTLCTLWAVSLLAEAGLPEGVLQVVAGDGAVVGSAVVDAVDYVCFTGSSATGRIVARHAADRLISCSLELGGKNSLYVAADADLDRAAEGAVRDCFGNLGQLCVSTERLLLHADIAEAFLDRFLDRVRRLRLGAELDFSTDLGCLISPEHLGRVQAHVEDALAHGARLLVGGRARPDLGPTFYEPTVLDGLPAHAESAAEETFGPVVAVYRVTSDAEAVSMANDTEYGLNASIWTRDLHRGAVLARQIRTGTVAVNEAYHATSGSIAAPMGGHKASGIGRRYGGAGLLRFTESQTVLVQRLVGLGPLYAQGPERTVRSLTLALRAARTLRLPWP